MWKYHLRGRNLYRKLICRRSDCGEHHLQFDQHLRYCKCFNAPSRDGSSRNLLWKWVRPIKPERLEPKWIGKPDESQHKQPFVPERNFIHKFTNLQCGPGDMGVQCKCFAGDHRSVRARIGCREHCHHIVAMDNRCWKRRVPKRRLDRNPECTAHGVESLRLGKCKHRRLEHN